MFLVSDVTIFFLLILKISFSIRFFNSRFYYKYTGESKYLRSDSLFSMSVYYSPDDTNLYVGAPNAVRENSNIEVGGVFKCTSLSQCKRLISIPNENSYNTPRPYLRPLFGMTIKPNDQDKLVVCGPNMPLSGIIKYFCLEFYLNNGSRYGADGFAESDSSFYIDNFGMMMENITFNDKIAFLIGQNRLVFVDTILHEIRHKYLTKFQKGLPRIEVSILSIPSYTILVNHINSNSIYIVVTYYETNRYLGSFEVKNQKLESQQHLIVTKGSFFQYFGFSGCFGLFNNDSCIDSAISAPFYSEEVDEGIVYIYYCNSTIFKFIDNPTMIHGDKEPFARFGIAVIHIGDLNRDKIDDIAVLAPYWYNKKARVFIYTSDGQKLSSRYTQIIMMEEDSQYFDSLSYGLLAQKDENKDKVIDLLITYPSNNTMKVVTGIAYKKLEASISYKVIYDMPNPIEGCFILNNEKTCANTSQYNVTTCLTVLYWDESEIKEEERLQLRYSLENSPGSMILGPNKMLEMVKLFEENIRPREVCFEIEIVYIYSSISRSPIQLDIVAEIIHNISQNCTGFCIDADPIILSHIIPTKFSTCGNDTCQPYFNSSKKYSKAMYIEGDLTNFNISLNITNDGQITSHFTQLVIEYPQWVEISSIEFDMIEISAISSSIETSLNGLIKVTYTIQIVTSLADKIATHVMFLINGPIYTKSFEINFLIFDPMYTKPIVHNMSVFLSRDDTSLISLNGVSSPRSIVIMDNANSYNESTTGNISYIIQVFNRGNIKNILNIEMEINITMIFDTIIVLALKNATFIKDLTSTICKGNSNEICVEEQIKININNLDAQSSEKITLIYAILQNINKLNQKLTNKIQLSAKACYLNADSKICEKLLISTEIIYPASTKYALVIWPIVLAIAVFIIIVTILITIIIMTKCMERFKKGGNTTGNYPLDNDDSMPTETILSDTLTKDATPREN